MATFEDNRQDGQVERGSQRRTKVEFLVIGAIGVLMFLLFMFLPVRDTNVTFWDLLTFWVGLFVLSSCVVIMALREMKHTASDDLRLRMVTLLVLIVASLCFFGLVNFRLGQVPGEFVGMATHLDSMYFTFSTAITVGFGDIHASGQLGRAVVLIQMIFNVVVLASAARLIAALLRDRHIPADSAAMNNGPSRS